MVKLWRKAEGTVDFFSEILGRIGWLIVIYAIFFGLADVVLRYVFDAPSMWISVTIQYAMVALTSLAGVYSLNNGAFVKLDIFYDGFSDRTKAIVDLFTSVLTFLYLYVIILKGFTQAMNSLGRTEMTPTAVQLPLYHLKFLIPICGIFMLLAVLKKTGIDIETMIRGHAREEHISTDETNEY